MDVHQIMLMISSILLHSSITMLAIDPGQGQDQGQYKN